MTSLNFQAGFADRVASRVKRQSIRRNGARFHIGGRIQLYTGMRTRACRKLVEDDPICTSLAAVEISAGYLNVSGLLLEGAAASAFASADGFGDIAAFEAFFLSKGDRFEGVLITWDWL